MIDVNDVKAGTYEVACLQFDKITSKPGDPLVYTRYRRGDAVELDVATARRLVRAGAVVEPGAAERAAAEAARLQYEAALAALPAAVREQVLGAGVPETVETVADGPAVPGPVAPADGPPPVEGVAPAGATEGNTDGVPERPLQVAPKALWIDYRVAQGMSAEVAEQATKAQLIKAEPPTFTLVEE